MSSVKSIPEGMLTVTPHIVCRNASSAIEFYKEAFGAEEKCRMLVPGGNKILHAGIQIGDSMVFLVDEIEKWGAMGPEALGGSPVTIHLYVEDVDSVFQKAVNKGATVTMELMDAFWGDRYGRLKDPFGHHWSLATHIEDVSPQEMEERARICLDKK